MCLDLLVFEVFVVKRSKLHEIHNDFNTLGKLNGKVRLTIVV